MTNVQPSLESQVANELSSLLREIPVATHFIVEPSADLCYSLELFLPRLLSRRFSEWENESLDGIIVAEARKIGPRAAQFCGTCILISDQTVTPFFLDIVLSPNSESITSYRACLGEEGGGRLGISGPECNSVAAKQLLATVTSRLETIRWTYTVASDSD